MLGEESDAKENAMSYFVLFELASQRWTTAKIFFLFVGCIVARARAAVWLEFHGELLLSLTTSGGARSVRLGSADKDLSVITSHPMWDPYVWVLCKVLEALSSTLG
jgi:hypothetical protein